MRKMLFLSLLLLLSCDKDDKLRLAIEDSPNADCLKSIFAKITNISRKAGYSHVIYEHKGDISNTDKARNLLNSLYHSYNMFDDTTWYEEKKKEESSRYFDSYMANLLSLEKGHLGWDFVYNFQGKLKRKTGIDFETKSTEPIQIIAKIIEFKNFHKLETYKVIGEVLFSFVEEKGTLKISDVETKGASLRKTLSPPKGEAK